MDDLLEDFVLGLLSLGFELLTLLVVLPFSFSFFVFLRALSLNEPPRAGTPVPAPALASSLVIFSFPFFTLLILYNTTKPFDRQCRSCWRVLTR